MKNELTQLPEKWAVKITEENAEILNRWNKDLLESGEDFRLHASITVSRGYFYPDKVHSDYLLDGYIEITFEQFEKWVLNKQDEYGVFYPEKERIVLVRNSINREWCKRVIMGKKNGIFYCWGNAETIKEAKKIIEIIQWNLMKEIEPLKEITLEELAEMGYKLKE